jgi:hypothetical protein
MQALFSKHSRPRGGTIMTHPLRLFRYLVIALLLATAAALLGPAVMTRAAPIDEVEPNNSSAQAQALTAIGANSPVSAQIDTPGDVDYYKFDAVAGRSYAVELYNAASALGAKGLACIGNGYIYDSFGLALFIFNSTGTQVAGQCDAAGKSAGAMHHRETFSVPADGGGTYYIKVLANTTATGFYKLRILPKYDQPGAEWDAQFESNNGGWNAYPITPGATNALTSDIDLRSPIYSTFQPDVDYYRFQAVAGRTYVIELFNVLTGLGGQGLACIGNGPIYESSGLSLMIFDTSGNKLAGECNAAATPSSSAGNAHHIVEFVAPSTGTFYIRLSPNDPNAAGAYSLRVLPKFDEPGASWDQATFEPNNSIWNSYAISTSAASAITSQIEPRDSIYSTFVGDQDWYRFSATAAKKYVVELFDVASGLSGGGTCLKIFTAANTQVAGECSGGGPPVPGQAQHRVQFVASLNGLYHIQVAPNNANTDGNYGLRVCQDVCDILPTPTATSTPTATPTTTSTPTSVAGTPTATSVGATPTPTATSVPPTPTPPPPWLVLLYISADDVPRNAPGVVGLSEPAQLLLNRLKWVMPGNPAMRLVVYFDGAGEKDTRIYMRDTTGWNDVTSEAASSPNWPGGIPGEAGKYEANSGAVQTLTNFIHWARARYPGSQHSMLSIIDHGGGWAPDYNDPPGQPRGLIRVQAGSWRGISLDVTSDGSTISTRGLGQALQGNQRFDVVFLDACLMGMLEVAYEVRDSADYLVAGENLLFAHFPYENYLEPDALTRTTTPRVLAIRITERYNYRINGKLSPFVLSTLDLRQLRGDVPGNLAARVNTLAGQLLNALPNPVPDTAPSHPLVQAIFQAYAAAQKFDYDTSLSIDPTDGYVDLADFARQLRDSPSPAVTPEMREAAQAVIDAASTGEARVVVQPRRFSGTYNGKLWNFDNAHGLSIYLPLGERDYRPSFVDPEHPDDVTKTRPERQLDHYTDPQQLALTAGYPLWSRLLERLEPAVRRQRNGSENAPISLLSTDIEIIKDRFNAPAPAKPIRSVYLPMTIR